MTDIRLPDWPPYGLAEPYAAYYLGVSVGTFRKLVRNHGEALAPTWLSSGRKVWRRPQLEAWLDARAGLALGSSQDWLDSL